MATVINAQSCAGPWISTSYFSWQNTASEEEDSVDRSDADLGINDAPCRLSSQARVQTHGQQSSMGRHSGKQSAQDCSCCSCSLLAQVL